MQNKYTTEEILKAAEIGEVSMIDAKHIVSLLDEARYILEVGFNCHKCKHSYMNPFDEYYCLKKDYSEDKEYDIENNINCGGIHYEK